ncbi:MAG: hypothetical protein NTW74_14535 [Acidobacteria bacterium]|nr:hypothetical protein [Acidobacteriota bacterium]
MANKSDFTVDEWDLFRKIPMLTGLVVMSASPSGPIGIYKESLAASEVLRTGLDGAHSELMRVLAEDLKINVSMHKMDSDSAEGIRAAGLAGCRELSNILRAKASEEEAEEFKCWLTTLARSVAEAAREGGFLGFGGKQVTPEEESILDQIEIALR